MLPGIVSDRFFKLAMDNRPDSRVIEDGFTSLLTTVFCGKISEKMAVTFQMFDFNNDGYINAEDVRLVLSYIPFKTNAKRTTNRNKSQSSESSECSITS
jgi:Ca2+-binding EF-hand superfamily protein